MQTAAYTDYAVSVPRTANHPDAQPFRDHPRPTIGQSSHEFQGTSDFDLIDRCRANSAAAFEELMSRYDRYMYAVAMRLAGNPEDANDLVSETAIRIYNHIGEFQHAVTLPAWIKRIMTNVYLDTRRSASRKPAVSLERITEEHGDALLADNANEDNDPCSLAESNELRRILADAINSLPETHRKMVTLYHAQEQTYEEIAARMKVPVGTVKSRLNRARSALRQRLAPHMATLLS